MPRSPDGTLVGPGDFVVQLEQVFRNLDIAVREAGGRFSDVVKLNYYCHQSVDRSLLRNVSIVRDRYVDTARPPASTFIFVAGLARAEWLIEIEALLALPSGDAVAVHATLTSDRPISERLRAAAQQMGKATRAEPGCLDYRIGLDVERPNILVLTERWRSRAALGLHFDTPHMDVFRAALRSEGEVKTSIEIFEIAGSISLDAIRSAAAKQPVAS